jgi:hypothetical protein
MQNTYIEWIFFNGDVSTKGIINSKKRLKTMKSKSKSSTETEEKYKPH